MKNKPIKMLHSLKLCLHGKFLINLLNLLKMKNKPIKMLHSLKLCLHGKFLINLLNSSLDWFVQQ